MPENDSFPPESSVCFRRTLLVFVFCSCAFPVILQAAGTTAANFLKIPAGARASGMGEAYTALADDASAMYWNPAGLSALESKEFFVSHNIWFQNIQHSYAAFAVPLDIATYPRPFAQKTIGVSIAYLGMNDIERRTANTAAADGNFGASDMALSLAYSRNIAAVSGRPLACGVSLKYIRQAIDTYSADAFAADLGMMYPFTIGRVPFKTGAAIQNLGTPVKFINESYPLPLTYKAGVSCKPLSSRNLPLLVAGDLVFPNDADMSWNIGAEYVAARLVALRIGYTSRNETVKNVLTGSSFSGNNSNMSTFTGFMAGIGFTIPLRHGGKESKDAMNLDYAFAPYGELGETHRISLGIKW